MSEVTIGRVGVEHLEELARVREQAFNRDPAGRAAWIQGAEPDAARSGALGGFVGGRPVAMLHVHSMAQWFGGRPVPMGGVAGVVVRPEHRARGIASRLLDRALQDMRSRGQVVSSLHPATLRPYRPAGWEVAGARDLWAVPTAALGHLAAPGSTDPTVRRATHGDRDGVAACYERVARSRPGWLRRDAAAWEAVGAEEPPAYRYVAARGETIVGFTAYRHTADPSEADTFGLRVGDLVAEDGAAEQALWRVFAAHGAQVPEIVVEGGTHEPVAHLLRELDVRVRQRRPWMTRLVDVAGAVAARGFPAAVSLRVELRVVDPRAPWNDGPWVLEVDGGQGRLAAGGSGAVTTTARALGPLYSGWSSAWRLAAAGELTGAAAEDLAGLDAAFAGPRPTMADYF